MGKNGSSFVGYRYHLGAHLALCHGPVDAIREIRVDDRIAWSALTNGGAVNGAAGVGDQVTLGSVANMAAVPYAEHATITFPGRLAGARVDQRYELTFEATGATDTVTLERIGYSAVSDTTTWEVTPASLDFAAQLVTVREATATRDAGGARGGRITIDAPNLFGGDAREGGITGEVDVEMGAPDQGPNDYLAAQAGRDVPGYRGIAALVLRQVGLGYNPYLKPWSVRVSRVLAAEEGALQWYPETAEIHPPAGIGDAAILIAMDASGSMSGSRMTAQRGAVATLMAELAENAIAPNDVEILTWSSSVQNQITRRNCGAAEYADLKAWVEAIPNNTNGGTDFGVAVSTAAAFFAGANEKRRILVFLTDGAPSPTGSVDTAKATLAGISELDVFAFNIALTDTSYTERLDTTPVDGVPVIPGGNADALANRLRSAFGRGPDMNPAHIIRECLTNASWGLGYAEADIGQSFGTAADTLFGEGFGLSLIWQRSGPIEDFLSDILAHIDAHLYVDRRSGRWELTLIRDDYEPATVPVFDDATVVDWGTLGRREAADLVNSVTVRFTDGLTDKPGAVTVTDPALVQIMGTVIPATVDYPGIRSEDVAARVAARDLRALSAPILSGEITVIRTGIELDPGDVIRLESPDRGLEGVLVRIVEIDLGDGRQNGIRLKIAEDVFGLGATALSGGRRSAPTSLVQAPKPLARRMAIEAPYWRVVQELGHTQADAALTEDPDRGTLLTAAERPSGSALAALIWTDVGAGYQRDGETGFVPTARLAADLTDDPAHAQVPVEAWTEIGGVQVGTLASVGEELVRVDGVASDSVTLGRGCLDTVPMAHAAGTPILFWQGKARTSAREYLAGESLDVKLLTRTGDGTLALANAPVDTMTMASRAIRPLPPGAVRANGLFVSTLPAKTATLSWAHRDRKLQTGAVIDDFLAPSIGPEAGVAYEVRIHWVEKATGTVLEPAAVVIPVGQATSYALQDSDFPTAPAGVEEAAIRVRAIRDGYDDFAFREYRAEVGGKVHITEQAFVLVFEGPSVDVSKQELMLTYLGPSIDVTRQEVLIDHRPPKLGLTAQEVVLDFRPPEQGVLGQELAIEIIT